MPGMILEALLASAEHHGGRPAVADPFRSLDYGNLVRFADVMRRQIESATSARHVGIMMPSTCAFAGTFYGALWAKRVAVPLNFLLQPGEIEAVVRDAGIDTIFGIKPFAKLLDPLPVKVIYIEDLPLKREMVLQRVRRQAPLPKTEPDDLAVLIYTSGTAGEPKGVCLTYNSLKHDVDACAAHARLTGEHRFLGVLPLFHSFGLAAMLLVPISLGASAYYLPRFQPAAIPRTVREQGSSVLLMIASMFSAILRNKGGTKEDFATMEYPISGGEALPMSVYEGFRERFGVEILQGYGMTEASPIVSVSVPWSHKVGTVGQPIGGVTVRAFDESDVELSSDEVGELWVRGPILMRGYYKKDSETRAVLTPDGWYKTGDMGAVDSEGYITITGRKKEMIIVGGENVYPREIESVLDAHPAVAESAAIGRPDPSRGEVVVAFVILDEGAEATENTLREYCRNHIAGYKVPRRIVIADDFPRGPTGKILKRKLRESLLQELA